MTLTDRWYCNRAGISMGSLAITWLDLWTGRYGVEITFRFKALLVVGF